MPGSQPRHVHIGIDVRMADAPGIGTYLRNLVPRVITARPSWRFTLCGARSTMAGLGWTELNNVSVHEMTAPIYSVNEQIALFSARSSNVDAFWSPHYNIPLGMGVPLLVTVHDLIHLARPEYTEHVAKRLYARLMFQAVRRQAAAIVTVSEFTRREFLRLVGTPRAPITVAHNGVDARWFAIADETSVSSSESTTPAGPYIVCVGSLKPHKNVGALITAFATLLDRIPHELVIVGRVEGLRTADAAPLEMASICGDRVRFTGELSEPSLRSLVAGASALVQPSLYEGFGLPPLEAMAAGCPCLVSRAASMPEICGDAALYCNPLDAADIAARLYELLTDERLKNDLSVRGRTRAATFQWSRSAESVLTVLDRLLDGSTSGQRAMRGENQNRRL